jgi:O-methyltransferase involved in polyketide biosynthesis
MRLPSLARIGPTAHYTAYAWHLMGQPEAHRFATRTGQLLHLAARPLRRLARWIGIGDPLAILLASRHQVLEHVLASSGCHAYVELGAGLSHRGLAYTRDPDVVFVEVDLPHMSRLKADLVGGTAGPGLHFVAGDALDPGTYDRIAAPVAGRGPVAVVAEGLNAYLPRDALEAMCRQVARLLARTGGTFLLEVNPADAVARFGPFGHLFATAVRTVARSPVFLSVQSRADAVGLMARAGFDSVVVHDPRDHPATRGTEAARTRGVVLIVEGRIQIN